MVHQARTCLWSGRGWPRPGSSATGTSPRYLVFKTYSVKNCYKPWCYECCQLSHLLLDEVVLHPVLLVKGPSLLDILIVLEEGKELFYHDRVLHRPTEYTANPIDVVAHPGEDLGEIQDVLPVMVRHRADAHNITVVTAVPLHTHGRDRQEGGGLLQLLAIYRHSPLLFSGHVLNPIEKGVLLRDHILVINHQPAQDLRKHTKRLNHSSPNLSNQPLWSLSPYWSPH